MGLVPQDPKQAHITSYHRRSISPPRDRSSLSNHSREGGRNADKDKDDYRGSHRDRPRPDNTRGRDRSGDNIRDGRYDSDRQRASPQYDDYRRPLPLVEGRTTWSQSENMYPDRRGDIMRDRSHGGSGADFMESRRLQRESQVVNVWPSSPKSQARSRSPKRGKSSRKSKRARSPSTSDPSSDEERRRRESKEKKRARREREKEKERGGHNERRSRRSRSPRRSYDHDDDEDHRRQHRSRRSATKTRSRSRSRDVRRSPARSTPPSEHDDDWVVKSPLIAPPVAMHSEAKQLSLAPPPVLSRSNDQDESDEEIGPQPMVKVNSNKRFDERSYGGALLRGEGSAMAAFLQEGTEARIPRRGEIGLTSEEIAKYEDVGYVMSGSRHRRMNAVRMRKENQVISAEEKRGILKLQREERERRESILREEFNELVNERLKGVPTSGPK